MLEGDRKACFDAISHHWLEAHVPMDKALLHHWLKAGYIDKHLFHQTEEGTPQGGPISPVLAKRTVDGLEAKLPTLHPGFHQSRRAKINLVRFADDFIIPGSWKELLENEVKPLVEAFLKERGVQLSTEKPLITHIADGFEFLGQNVRKYEGKLIIKPSLSRARGCRDAPNERCGTTHQRHSSRAPALGVGSRHHFQSAISPCHSCGAWVGSTFPLVLPSNRRDEEFFFADFQLHRGWRGSRVHRSPR